MSHSLGASPSEMGSVPERSTRCRFAEEQRPSTCRRRRGEEEVEDSYSYSSGNERLWIRAGVEQNVLATDLGGNGFRVHVTPADTTIWSCSAIVRWVTLRSRIMMVCMDVIG